MATPSAVQLILSSIALLLTVTSSSLGSPPLEPMVDLVEAPQLRDQIAHLERTYPDTSGAQKYDESGHKYTTYIVSMAAGLGRDRSYVLAYFSQFPDDEKQFSATRGAFYFHDLTYRSELMSVLHSLHGGGHSEVLQRRSTLATLVARGRRGDLPLKDYQIGLMIHALADAYAHTKGPPDNLTAFNHVVGHLFHGHKPDLIAYDPEKFRDYACTLFQALADSNDCATKLSDLNAFIQGLETRRNAELRKFETYARDEFSFKQNEYDAIVELQGGKVTKEHVRETVKIIEDAVVSNAQRACAMSK